MAIIKELNSSYGCLIAYHRITSINIHYQAKKIVLCVASYLSKETRANQMEPLEEIDIEVPISDFSIFKNTNVIETGYIWLKNNVIGFEDSVDDFDVLSSEIHPVQELLEVDE